MKIQKLLQSTKDEGRLSKQMKKKVNEIKYRGSGSETYLTLCRHQIVEQFAEEDSDLVRPLFGDRHISGHLKMV